MVVACQRANNNPLREPAYFGKVYAQVLLSTQLNKPDTTDAKTDSLWRRARIDSVLASRRLTRAQLDDAVQFFSADPQRWREVYQHVVSELDSLSFARRYSQPKISP